jgi:copper chaperone
VSTTTQTSSYLVAGMTCAHCVAAVREEIANLDAVQDVEVDLVPGGTSRVTITSAAPVPDDRVRAAVDEAGYALVEDTP